MRTPIFGDSDPKNYRLKFNILELVSTFKKSGYFIDLFWRFCSFINAAILLAESILLHILGTSFLHQTDDLQYNNTENNKNFNYRTNSAKVKNYFFLINWKKKTISGLILTHFVWGKRCFSKKIWFCHEQRIWFKFIIEFQ